MVWDGKRSPIKFLIIISPAESGVVAVGEEEEEEEGCRSKCVCVCVCGWEVGIVLVGEGSRGIWCFN